MSKATFLSNNFLLDSNISLLEGSVNAQFPLSNLLHDFSTKVFRSSTTGFVTIYIDLKSIKSIDFVALRGSCVDSLGFTSATLETSLTEIFNGDYVDINNISFANNLAFKELNLVSCRYIKITLFNTGIVELANLFIGRKVQLDDNNISSDFAFTNVSNNVVSKNKFGQRFIDTYSTQKVLSGSIKLCNAEEFSIINEIHNLHRESIALWFFLDKDNNSEIEDGEFLFSGMFYMQDVKWKHISAGLWDCSVELEECL